MSSKEITALVVLVLLFLISAFLVREYGDLIARQLDFGVWGVFVYIVATILATVVAPLSTVPLIPVAATLWGPLATSLLNILSWWTGSVIAFIIARKYGRPYVGRIVKLDNLAKYEKVLSGKYLFWNVLLLRMAIPVDVFSYAIGLFTTMRLKPYMLATVIGITPFAFLLSYAVEAPLMLQVVVGVLVLVAIYLGYRRIKKAPQERV